MARNLLQQQKASEKKAQTLKNKEEKRTQLLSQEEQERQKEEQRERQEKQREQAEKEKDRQRQLEYRAELREKARERVTEKATRYSEDTEDDNAAKLAADLQERETHEQENKEMKPDEGSLGKGGFLSKPKQKKAFIVFIGVLTAGLMAVIITNTLKNSGSDSNEGDNIKNEETTGDVYTVYEETGKYSVDSEGNLTYTNGDDIAQSLESIYLSYIKSSMTLDGNEYSQDFVSENGQNGTYNHGTKNGEAFDEAYLYADNGGSYCLAKTGDTFMEAEEMISSYIDVPSLIMSVLFSDNVERVSDTEFKASVSSDYFSFCLPHGTNGYTFYMDVTVKKDGDNITVSASGSNLEGKSLYYMYGDDDEEAEETKTIDSVSFTATYSKFSGYSYDFTSILEELNSRVSEEVEE